MFRQTLEEYETMFRHAMVLADKLEEHGFDMSEAIIKWIGAYRSSTTGLNSYYHVSMADQFDFIDKYGITHICFTVRGQGKRFRVLVPVNMLDTSTEEWEPFADTPDLHNYVVRPKRPMPPCPMGEEPHG